MRLQPSRTFAQAILKGITAEEVQRRLDAGEKLYILDVRESEEVEASPLPIQGTLVISLSDLRERWQEIKMDSLIVAVCGLGIRGYEAVCMLQGKGLSNIAYLQGGISVPRAYFN